jgi:short-subunit dehydrogenase
MSLENNVLNSAPAPMAGPAQRSIGQMNAVGAQPEPGPGTIALVTGASSGIGAATARRLAAGGVTVALVARRADRLQEVLADCLTSAPDSRSWPADLADPEQAAALARTIWDELGAVDILVNNAGVPMRRPAQRLTMVEVERAMTINYLSPVAMTLALLPDMLDRGTGTIVNVSSLGGRLGIATEAAYCGSKFALAGWSESLYADLHGTGVAVRLVLPGAIDTEIWDQPDNDAPMYSGPLVPADEVAEGIVACIASPSFEHYLPDLKAVVEMKTADFDGFVTGMLAMADGQVDEASVARTTDPDHHRDG